MRAEAEKRLAGAASCGSPPRLASSSVRVPGCRRSVAYLLSLFSLVSTPLAFAQPPQRPLFVPSQEEVISAASRAIGTVFLVKDWADSYPTATVSRVVAGANADLVLLKAGFRQNFRPGMLCLVGERDQAPGTALVIAEADAQNAVALVVEQVPGATLKAGDTVRIKTVQFSR
ncbi:MAG: hypothetical protein LBD01_04385 [Puniceicoccales bacterium]|nr:hypothetical protein [Puniceicoccales bacterium]